MKEIFSVCNGGICLRYPCFNECRTTNVKRFLAPSTIDRRLQCRDGGKTHAPHSAK